MKFAKNVQFVLKVIKIDLDTYSEILPFFHQILNFLNTPKL